MNWFKKKFIDYQRERLFRLICWLNLHDNEERNPELQRYSEDHSIPQWMDILSIEVDSEYSKQQLLAASKYIHDLWELDTDYQAVNVLAHLYTSPDLIKVRE